MKQKEIIELELKANSLREKILEMIVKANSGHLAPAFSIIELLTVLYYKILNINPAHPVWPERDRFILSKGHGCAALYAILAEKGFFPLDALFTFCQPGSILGSHPEMQKIPGVEASTGSLGHGLSIAVGISLAGRFDRRDYRTFCLVGDGECNEGSIWEAAMSASHHKLDNLTAIIDYNKLQASGTVKEVLSTHPMEEKWRAFGWKTVEVDGHNIKEVFNIFKKTPFKKGKPSAIIAHTVKGKGISFVENEVSWHTLIPNNQEYELAKNELRKRNAKLSSKIKKAE
ncbi:MAG: transketolase [Candidatus Omnitrophota bacterium]